ncbi:shikimate dehydrogenase [Rhizobium sp. AB2/73]|uniref:shikimate dehydrogenase n=1 Tax=Rhizobium sp. AB2/73 TaxID=2795216 RepID=UPI000DD62AFD|nr:shikimate dehydrogenase [Rhizobium sp. AB2/73]QYA16505.1 shikimate dehydrogenase [Rhizobium sp. AB2/73]UEQ85048.1 shikimate dehydrogenase [Rhizobium sp. AB2/73]
MNTQAAIVPRQLHVGLIGAGIGRSLTPAMHMREGEHCGLSYRYDLIDLDARGLSVSDLPALIDEAEAMGFAGLNITHPCKQAAVALVDELSPDAQTLRSINTIVFDGRRRIGHNTDWWGFAESFRRGLAGVSLDHLVQLGAGGAGVAVAHAVAEMGAHSVEIFDLDPSRAQALVDQLQPAHAACRFSVGHDLAAALGAADGLVHATPTGMAAHPGLPLDAQLLSDRLWVAEIVYFPIETALVKRARQTGCRVLDGGGMAVFQAVKAFELFTGIRPAAERMMQHFNSLRA